jgi:DNA-binding MarR family transcriptional regulator
MVRQPTFERAIELIYFAHRAVVAEPDRVLARRGLSRVHHRILYCVARRPDITIAPLCEVLGVSKQALHRPLGELERRGLIERRIGDNRRQRCVRLTARGVKLEQTLMSGQRQRIARAFRAAGPAAVAGWVRVGRLLL